MAVTSYRSCGTCVDDSSIGSITWTLSDSSPLVGTELSADDDVVAGLLSPTSGGESHYLKCTNFGFSESDIPYGALIQGFEIEVRQTTSSPGVSNTVVQLVQAGIIVGDDFGTSGDWPATEEAVVYGSSSELGGMGWTLADVTASDFGCVIAINLNIARLMVEFGYTVDQVRIRVYYVTTVLTGFTSIANVNSITF